MKLSEKIFSCRRRAGLSQEALAEKLGVSRQAVSKWETGEAVPEISKLLLMSRAFGVTTDWLLSEEEPERSEEPTREEPPSHAPSGFGADAVPGMLGRLVRRWGWLAGVYLAVSGALITGLGAMARYLTRRMFTLPIGGDMFAGYSALGDEFSGFAANNPVSVMGTVFIVVGIAMTIAGIALAVILKRRGQS